MSCAYGKIQYGISGSRALFSSGGKSRQICGRSTSQFHGTCLQLWCEEGVHPLEVKEVVTWEPPLPSLELRRCSSGIRRKVRLVVSAPEQSPGTIEPDSFMKAN